MSSVKHPASLRDPAGFLITCGSRLFRVIRPEFVKDYRSLLDKVWLQKESEAGAIVKYRILEPAEATDLLGPEAADCLCLEHNVIAFPSYPSEWPLEMLCAAAEQTLVFCVQALQNGCGLKDATPFNILFEGPRPVFVDILSFEKRDRHDPTWLPHGQFIRAFLLPAMMDALHGVPCHQTFLSHRDGVEPEEVYRLLSPLSRFFPPFLGTVTMPVLLSTLAERNAARVYGGKTLSNQDQSDFVLKSLFSSLWRQVQSSSRRKHPKNVWSTYNETCTYTDAEFAGKTTFVEEFLQMARPTRVLDVGCNTGHFSFLAAKTGSEVVATDLDPEVVGLLWQRAREEEASILPLVINLARPTPAQGWRNRETLSFLDRAEGYFDAVLMLAVVHHLLVTDQIPLEQIIEQASRLTQKWLVTEFVGPDDPQFKRLLRGREALYRWYGRDIFEQELGKRFEIVSLVEISDSGRWLYLARRRDVD